MFIGEVKTMGKTLMVQASYPIEIKDGKYEIDIREIGKHRSLEQNAMLWGIIAEISKSLYGDISEKDNIYLQLLEMSGARYTLLTLKKEAFDDKALDKFGIRNYRVIKENDSFVSVIAFYGSSTFNTKEMTQLIETTLRYADECGVKYDNDYWEGVING